MRENTEKNKRRTIGDFTDKELADMVRNSGYIDKGTTFGDGPRDSRFLLVLAVPYGNADGVDSTLGAIVGFRDLVSDENSAGTNYQIYDHRDDSFTLTSLETELATTEEPE